MVAKFMEKVKKITEGKVALPNVQNLAQALTLNTDFDPYVPPCSRRATTGQGLC